MDERPKQRSITDSSKGESDLKRLAGPRIYQIRVEGHLDDDWSEWLGGLAITHEGDDRTLLTGLVIDQPALYGLLIKLRDLGLTLISINCLEPNTEGPGRDREGDC